VQGCGAQLPESLDPILARTQSREPSKRYADAGAFWEALEPALSGIRSSARVVAAPAPDDAFGRTVKAPTEKLGLRYAEFAALESGKEAPRPSGTYVPPYVEIPPAPARDKAILEAAPANPNAMKIVGGIILAVVVVLAIVGRTMSLRARSGPPRNPGEDPSLVVSGEATAPLGATQGAPPATVTAACRLCVTHVKTIGPLSEIEVTRAIDRELVRLEAQCVGRPTVRRGIRSRAVAGTASIAFVASDGRASNRSVVASTASDGTDECLMRGFSDLSFPMHKDDTNVTVTLSFDPSR
jgi:hypothetical protein